MTKVITDEELRKLMLNQSVKTREKVNKTDHPYIQHMAKLEQLIKDIGVSNDGINKILKLVAGVLMNAQTDNANLMTEITQLQGNLTKLTNRLILDDDNDVWVATVKQRDAARLLLRVDFNKVTGKKKVDA